MNKETKNQIASVMLQSGTPEQQEEALAYCGLSKRALTNQDDANAEQTSKKIRELNQKVAQQEKQIQQLQMALADTEALEAGTAERCCRWRESHKMSQAKVIEKSAVIERLQLAIKAVEIDSDECMDFDECTAMLIPLDTYHQLIEAIPTDSKQILADWMREQKDVQNDNK